MPKGLHILRHERERAHEYAPSDPAAICRVNLAVRLYAQLKAGEDWRRWAVTTGDPALVSAVDAAIRALETAHRIAAPKEQSRLEAEEGTRS